jgi:DNA-binding NarL/FixJ family response regulator
MEGNLVLRTARLLVLGSYRGIQRALRASEIADRFATRELATLADLVGVDRRSPPDLFIIALPKLDGVGLATIKQVAQRFPDTPRLVVVEHALDREVVAAVRAGASGCLFREDLGRRLVSAVHEAMDGGAPMSRSVARVVLERARRSSAKMAAVRLESKPPPPLGPRRREVLELLARGRSYEEAAALLGMSLNTVRSHVREIYAMLGVTTKVEAVMVAIQRGILRGPPS